MKKNSMTNSYYESVLDFQNYFNSDKHIDKYEFLSHLKKNMELFIIEKIEGKIKENGHHLYHNSDSYIYYPIHKKNLSSKKGSVLLVLHELGRTGAPIVTLDTAKVLVNNGYFVVLISLMEGALLNDFLQIGIPVIVMKRLKYLHCMRHGLENFVKYLDLDVFVDSFDITIMETATLYNCVRRYYNTNNKIIWWIHEGMEIYNCIGSLMPKYVSANIQVVCAGEYAATQLKNNNLFYNPQILNYGVMDDKKNHTNVKKKNKKIEFLLVGTIGVRKGQQVLLKAIKKLSKDLQQKTEFIFIGEPSKDDRKGKEIFSELKKYSENHSNVIVKPFMPREELYKMYKQIDVLVVPSIDDPMPVVATENFMLENVCICSSQTGTSYYINDEKNGFVFESGNVDELVKKIEYAIQNREKLSAIGKNGRKIYDETFEMSIFEENLIALLSDILKE